MRAPFVKVCGITRAEDAAVAVAAGARALGFVLVPESPRYVPPERAARIAADLPPGVARVGVVVNRSVSEVEQLMGEIGLTAIQAHGEESPAICRAYGVRLVKALAPGPEQGLAVLEGYRDFPILVDAAEPGRRGGTGRIADWNLARRAVEGGFRILLAGGLGPGNLAAACRAVGPIAVDLNSGVERRPGEKDGDRIRAAFEALAGMEPPEETTWPW